MKTARCSTCQAEIIWAISNVSGARIPIDASPVELLDAPRRGLFVLVKRLAPDPLAWAVSPDGPGLETFQARSIALYQTHFATCPDADEHQRRG